MAAHTDPKPEGDPSGSVERRYTLVDLRNSPDLDTLDSFVRLYRDSFPDPTEREDPAIWPAALRRPESEPGPQLHLLVARSEEAPPSRLAGGLVFEYFPRSRCGLLTYLCVEPAERRRGVGRMLVRRAVQILASKGEASGSLPAIFAEVEDPDQAPSVSAIPPRERLLFFGKLGARRLNIPYVQPQLQGGSGRARHLLLLAIPIPADCAPYAVPAVVGDFLTEYYESLGVGPDDIDLQEMLAALRTGVSLQALEAHSP